MRNLIAILILLFSIKISAQNVEKDSLNVELENSIKRFFKEKDAIKHYPSNGEGTLSGVMIEADIDTGLAKKVSRLIIGGSLVE